LRKLICPTLSDGQSFDPTDIVVTEKSFEGDRRGEEKLMVAVLEDAIKCFQKYALGHDHWEKRLFQEVEDWILKKNSEWLYSFENICETLQLNADYIRKGLRVWKEAKRKSYSVEDQGEDHTKLIRTRVAPIAARLSKTGQILMR
jgi:hypothetical protein